MKNIIIVDDNLYYQEKIKQVVQDVFAGIACPCQIESFDRDCSLLRDRIMDPSIDNKIYFIDIDLTDEEDECSAMTLANEIRKYDVDSTMYIMTNHLVKEQEILQELLSVSFIQKNESYEKHLIEELQQYLYWQYGIDQESQSENKKRVLKFEHKGNYYRIPFSDILKIDAIKGHHQIKLTTRYSEIIIPMTLREMKERLPSQFVYCHRCCIINVELIVVFHPTKRYIQLEQGVEIEAVSANRISDIIEQYELFHSQD